MTNLMQVLTPATLMVAMLAWPSAAAAQQVADTSFDVTVATPAFKDRHPRVLFDEAHHNFHTTGGRYKVFADLIRNDGFQVTANPDRFSGELLRKFDVLVISNALGAEDMGHPQAGRPAFADAECDAVRDWWRPAGVCCSSPTTRRSAPPQRILPGDSASR